MDNQLLTHRDPQFARGESSQEERLVSETSARLLVFVPSQVSARALGELMERSMPGIEVVVFGRFTDLSSVVRSLRPSAVLAPSDTLEALKLKPSVYGVGRTGRAEPYSVLTHSQDVTLGNLEGKRIGAVDVVGREALPQLVKKALGLNRTARVKRVLKIGDLVPLLSLELADAVLAPERLVGDLVAGSRLSLRVLRPPGALLGCAALSYPSGKPQREIDSGLKRFSEGAFRAVGITRWEWAQ